MAINNVEIVPPRKPSQVFFGEILGINKE